MGSIIMRTTIRYILPVLLLFSIVLLLRGHNEPGGGFCGGLTAAAAFAMYALAFDVHAARRLFRVDPPVVIGAGLALAAGSGFIPYVSGEAFMKGTWASVHIAGLGTVALGTPILFDAGVYLVVVGVALLVILSLAEEWDAD